MKKSFKIIAVVVLAIIVLGAMLGGDDTSDDPATTDPITTETPATPTEPNVEGGYGLGDTFQFDGSSGLIELTFGENITFTTVENQFSDLDGESVIIIPVTLTNIGDETGSLNMFDITVFGANGVSLDSVDAFFMDDDIRWGNDLRPGSSVESYLHILYDGDGEYVIEFAGGFGFGDTAELIFQVER